MVLELQEASKTSKELRVHVKGDDQIKKTEQR